MKRNITELVEARLEQRTDHCGGVVLGNHRGTGDLRARVEIAAPINRHILEFTRLRIEQRTLRPRLRFAPPQRHGFCELALCRRADRAPPHPPPARATAPQPSRLRHWPE